MKKSIKTTFFGLAVIAVACINFFSCTPAASGDETTETTANSMEYHVSENESDNIAIVKAYTNSLINGDGSVAQNSVTPNFKSYGPSIKDSATIEQVVAMWAINATNRTNQDAGIVGASSITVTSGQHIGDWVQLWGFYTCDDTQSGKTITIPWHANSKIDGGKISYTATYFDNLAPAMEVGSVVLAE